ncbi:MAG: HAD-IA family hydrolase [Clostridiaceae bacterium]|nr:HAD-IA family hydrolase [Clostridiaceae bacterium]MDY5890342.1 HAD-IA family hydrolase [Oscillospiraceae bacterium]
MKYNTYIFDLDGTLLDTLQDLANAVNHAMREMKYPERTVDEVRRFIGNGIRMLIKRASPQGISDKDYEKTLAIFTAYYLEHIADFTKPYDGIAEVIKTLKSKGCKVAVVSNKADEAAKKVVKDYFGDIFDMVVGKMDRFPSKPEPDSVLYVIETLGSDKDKCIYLGDSEVDVHTAHNAGLPCVGVTWGNRDVSELIAAGAEYIAEKPSEILEKTGINK